MPSGGFAQAFADALDSRSVSLGALQRSLAARGTRVGLATLSYWRSGQRQPERDGSIRALIEIEQILGLSPGDLESLLEDRRWRLPANALAGLTEDHDIIGDMLAELDFRSPSDRLIDREVTVKYDVGRDGSPAACTYMVAVEGIQAEAQRRATVLTLRPGARLPRITPLGGYRLGTILHDRERGIVVGEMLLDRPLLIGETVLLEQQVEYLEPDPEDTTYFYWAVRRMTAVNLWIRFHPDRLPVHCERYVRRDGVDQVEELHLAGSGVSLVTAPFGPGTVGVRWYWD